MVQIECKKLKKNYGSVKAVNDIDFTLKKGCITGLIGRNGAGKTTLLNIIAGILKPTEGNVFVDGESTFDNLKVLGNIFFARDEFPFISSTNSSLRIRDIMDIASIYYINWDREYSRQLLVDFKLDQKWKIKKLSKGNKTMVSIVMALASKAIVTIFDEPTEGLDAANRKVFYDLIIKEAQNRSRTFIISSHLLSELELLLEEIILLDKGKLIFHKTVDQVREMCIDIEGHRDEINNIISNKTIYNIKEIGEKQRAVIRRDEFNDQDSFKFETGSIRLNPVSAQDSCIYLTQEKGEFKK